MFATLSPISTIATQDLGEYLVEYGFISNDQLQIALKNQKDLETRYHRQYRLGDILVFRGWISRDCLEDCLSTLIASSSSLTYAQWA